VLIIFQKINFITIIPALLLGLFFDVYCLRVSARLTASGIFQGNRDRLTVKYLPLESATYLDGVRYFDYGEEINVYAQVDRMLTANMLRGVVRQFPSISDLNAKLKLALASSFGYYDVGAVALFLKQNTRYDNVMFVHTSLFSYIHQSSNVPVGVRIHHWFLPIDEIEHLFKSVVAKLRDFLASKVVRSVNIEPGLMGVAPHQFNTAVVFHQSTNYGKLFPKTHYFSKNPSNRLHTSKVLALVLGRLEPLAEASLGPGSVIRDLHRIGTQRDFIAVLRFLLSKISQVRTLDEFRGAIFLARIYYGCRGWHTAIKAYPSLKNVIVDYDILFPKTLALALESRGVRTVAMQERGSFSSAPIYGTMVDTYLLSGGLFTIAGQHNRSISCRKSVNFGPWRASLFFSGDVPDYLQLDYSSYGNRTVFEFERVIAVLGWFTPEGDTSASPIANKQSSQYLHQQALALAAAFPDCAVVLRFKLLSAWDRQTIAKVFSGMQNIFLCSDYSKMNASYALCKRADVVVSVQTSLAEECLFAGKKVVFLDETHNLKKICTDIYPEEFHFAFSKCQEQMIDMVSRCLNGDQNLTQQYQTLQKELNGNFDLSTPDIIPLTLETLLK
jgi:hypothetical protein